MKNRIFFLLTLFMLAGWLASGQSLIQLKQVQQGTANGQVVQRQGGVSVWDSLDFNNLKNKPALTGGTVTSVGVTMPSGFTVTGSPVTTSGTIAVTTTLNGIVKGNGSGFVVGAVNLGTEVTGTLPVGNGGTGLTSAGSNGQVPVSNGAGFVMTTPPWITGNQSITLSGDVTGTGTTAITTTIANNAVTSAKILDGTIATADIANSAITYGKMQNVSGNRLLGNATGTAAAPAEIPLGSGLVFSGGALAVNAAVINGIDTTVARTVLSGDIAGGNVTIPLGATPLTGHHFIVFVNGVKADITAISMNSTNAVISNASMPYTIAAGDRVEVAFTK